MKFKKYRVEYTKGKKDYYRIDVVEQDLEETKKLVKEMAIEDGVPNECFYREFPLGENKKVYF